MASTRRTFIAATLGAATLAAATRRASAAQAAPMPLRSEDYAQARARFRTRLTKREAAPDNALPLDAPAGATRISYTCDGISLAAWLSEAPRSPGAGLPAVLVLHGGNVLGAGHWDLAQPFVDAGFVAMIPSLRGENGQPGIYTGFYDETSDVLAAAAALASDPRVDPQRLFIAGHSIGGTQTLLAAMSASKFRRAAAFSGAPDAAAFFRRFPQMVCFDTADPAELEMRSAVCYAGSFKCPVRIWHGADEQRAEAPSRLTAERARTAGCDVMAATVPGGHSSALPEEIRRAIAFFGAA